MHGLLLCQGQSLLTEVIPLCFSYDDPQTGWAAETRSALQDSSMDIEGQIRQALARLLQSQGTRRSSRNAHRAKVGKQRQDAPTYTVSIPVRYPTRPTGRLGCWKSGRTHLRVNLLARDRTDLMQKHAGAE